MPSPPEIPMPSGEDFLLPQRAYLLSYDQQCLYARRVAIADSRAHLDGLTDSLSRHEIQLALLGLIGDAMQAVEDLGNLGAATMSGLDGLASYVKATIYDPSHVNNFFAQAHKRDDAYFLRLCGFRFEPYTMLDFFELVPPPSAREIEALEAAEMATAKLLREYLLRLAGTWERYRRFFHAYKHGALVANPEEVEIVDEDESPLDGMVIWARKQTEAAIGSHTTESLEEIAKSIQIEGELAIDVVEHLVRSRLHAFELISFAENGTPFRNEQRLKVSPWRFWMHSGDISEQDVAVLRARGIALDAVTLT